jgi:hypothetical protein
MKNQYFITVSSLLTLLCAGCANQRSISNSGYREENSGRRTSTAVDSAFRYRGELSEFDLLGIAHDQFTTEEQIRDALDAAKKVELHPSSSILLIQSGAAIPDGAMTTSLSKHFGVVPFSGIPGGLGSVDDQNGSHERENFARALRLAAARGKNDVILCYWGTLESANQNLSTHTVSWVPVVGWMLPDKREHMRILLKMALIDVRTGNWTLFSPEPFQETRLSTAVNRETSDQRLVERLKSEAYAASADELVKRFCAR